MRIGLAGVKLLSALVLVLSLLVVLGVRGGGVVAAVGVVGGSFVDSVVAVSNGGRMWC